MYGDSRKAGYQQDRPAAAAGSHLRTDTVSSRGTNAYHQITNIRKFSFRRSKHVKAISIEGNRIKVIHSNDFEMLENLETLHLRNNRIKLLWPQSLQGLSNLRELDLTSNHIKSLTKTLFRDTPQLKKLLLSENRIRSIHNKLLRPLKFLEELDLSNNLLKDLPKDVFNKLHVLKEINLDNNNIQMIRPAWFSDLQQLNSLSLKGNRIRKLSSWMFSSLSSLKHLVLEKNEISQLPLNVFEEANGLQTLTLAKNNISLIPDGAFKNLGHLQELYLDHNGINRLFNGSLNGLDRLLVLSLTGNDLVEITADTLKDISTVQRIYLSYNRIKIIRTMNFYGLADLRELKLDHNEIKVIEDEGFAISMVNTYSKLTWLYLQYNKLERITENMLYGLSYMKFLNLCHNSLGFISQGALHMVGRLHTLILNDNALKYINPGEFKQLHHLQHLNLAKNQLRLLPLDIFKGLENVRDLNLEKNFIEEMSPEIFSNTERVVTLNLRSNRLRTLDLNLLMSILHRLKYLDLGRNSISNVIAPQPSQRTLFYLSLADNNLHTLDESVLQAMSPGGSVRLYGNPWNCDCKLSWLRDLVAENQFKIPDSDEIVCKQPSHLTGEQIGSLSQFELHCAQSDGVSHYLYKEEQQTVACTFNSHARNLSTREHVKSRKLDLVEMVVTMYTNESQCSGVAISADWILTPSQCWKQYRGEQLYYGIGSFDKNTDDPKSAVIENIVFYPGPLDIAMIKVKDHNEVLSQRHVFPCVLSEEGMAYAEKNRETGIMQAETTSKSTKSSKVRFRGLPLRMLKDTESSASCLEWETSGSFCAIVPPNKNTTALITKHAPFFMKVGRTRWSLAGLGAAASTKTFNTKIDKVANQNVVSSANHDRNFPNEFAFHSLSQAIRWMDNIIFP